MKFKKREITQGNGNGGVFLKFKDGDSKVGILRGEIYEFFQYWDNGKSHVVDADHPQGKSRFRLNFVTKEDGELKAKIFEFGLTVYNQLADISDDYEIDKTAVKITRRGTGTDTVYMIIPSKEQPNAQQLKAIEAVPLNIVEHKDSPEPKKVKNFAPGAEDDELEF
jgi:hypothetical protein